MSLSAAKVSAVVATGVICLVLGAGAGAMGMAYFGRYQWSDTPPTGETRPLAGGPAAPAGPAAMAGGQRGPGGAGGMGGRGGARGPSSKTQLASLVTKLDQLTKKPLTVSLNDEQARKLREQLQGLAEKAELADDEAKKRLDAILEIVEGQKETLEAAGYRLPGQGGGGGRPPADAPNPFKDEQNGTHLKSLQEKLGKANNL